MERSVKIPIDSPLPLTDHSRHPKVIAQAYTDDSIWRNRTSFLVGTAAIEEFLNKKWEKERNYRLRKELFAFADNKIAVQFWYEYQDAHDDMKWKRCYGLEDWTFADDGKMRKRQMSGNDVEINEAGMCWVLQTGLRKQGNLGLSYSLTSWQVVGSKRAWMSTRSKSARRTGEGGVGC
jgi:nuclear transport factor 2 (NTF2) superfamily protein